IKARRVGWPERTWRWCRRNRVVACLLGTTAISLLAGTMISMYFAFLATERAAREARARETAEQQLKIATAERLAALSHSTRLESPEISLLLALESGRLFEDDDGLPTSSHQALLDALGSIGGIPLVGHHNGINSVAISPDSRWVITGAGGENNADETPRLWDLASDSPGTHPLALHGHRFGINRVAISPHGRWPVTATADK